MLRVLFLTIVLMCSTVLAQTNDKPKAYLFDEFGKISAKEIKLKTQKLRVKIKDRSSSDYPLKVVLIFYYGEKQKSSRDLQRLVRDVLYDDCRDCMGFNPMILFVHGGKAKEQKVQFWIVPPGAALSQPTP